MMGVSVEISLYPLNATYKPHILTFIERLRTHQEFTVLTNNMSTRVFGDYDKVMPAVTEAIKHSFDTPDSVVVVLKLVNKNLEE